VLTRQGGRALVVTELTAQESLSRLCAYNLATVQACISARWIEVGPVHRVPPYLCGKAGDSQAGQLVWITALGCSELGVPTPAQRRITAAQERCRVATRGTPEGSVDAEIRALRDGVDELGGSECG
jgi:hypothetical protein